ncbi:P1 family peptidase [Actinokineospora iranica]|uniref:L-aminopeptidase/D-esterase n=1 Tax=Actinokineospora iranica TaxID=1271860 RepID=A0A1G6X4W8_9PSEU|nr:P1 family peptidase [Actinokineospora iranica]SDD72306.1 L-aminopeptidase/D-esterase [Actinokineospora iranica]
MTHNAITDVAGVRVGHHHRLGDGWATGTTVVLLPEGTVGGVEGRGGAPGTRETDLLAPENLVRRVDAVCLSGGSAYGLAAADGVTRWLGERGRGFRVGDEPHEVVPIVPAAVVFDLPRSSWGNRPDAEFGYLACERATDGPVDEGSVGAGAGARAGSLKGGVGTASIRVGPVTLGALAVVNARGEAVDLSTGGLWAADIGLADEFPPAAGYAADIDVPLRSDLNTTVGVVAVDAALDKAECRRLAMAAQDGLARALRPAHSLFDGDTVFAAATGVHPVTGAADLDDLYAAAADVFARAVARGVLAATTVGGLRAYRDFWA